MNNLSFLFPPHCFDSFYVSGEVKKKYLSVVKFTSIVQVRLKAFSSNWIPKLCKIVIEFADLKVKTMNSDGDSGI